MRPIYHQIEQRVKAHIFVAALALLVQRLMGRRLEEAGIDFSVERAMEALTQHSTLGDVAGGGSGGASRGQRGLPGCASGPEGSEAGRVEAANAPQGRRNRAVVTIRKFDPYLPRTYVDVPQTWANEVVRSLTDIRHRPVSSTARFSRPRPSSTDERTPHPDPLLVEERVLGGVRGFCSEINRLSDLLSSQYSRFPV
jgi:hypothetical protein